MIQLGYFGKTIHRGDFVRFNLPKAFITVMDDWLQSVMINGESTHADQWPEQYALCPGYSFHLSPDIAGDNRWSGVIGASTDKVGRRFPFVIAAGLPDTYPTTWTLPAINENIAKFAKLLNQIKASDYDFDALQEQLTELSHTVNDSMNEQATGSYTASEHLDANEFAITTTGAQPGHAIEATGSVMDIVLRQSYFNHSIWSPLDPSPLYRGLITSGLPDDNAALALFDNNWESVAQGELDTPANAPEIVEMDTAVVEENTVAEQDAWSALDNSDVKEAPVNAPVQPQIEPLELEEDSSSKAPWD